MPLNPTKGNMYDWITHTWNTVKGECPHGCHYCYMKRWGKQKPVRFAESELKTEFGADDSIFVGSSCDMWAAEIPFDWIYETLEHCKDFSWNKYIFQSKNPMRIYNTRAHLPMHSVIGTTIESDILHSEMGNAPWVTDRANAMRLLAEEGFDTFVTIEPIMEFNLDAFVDMLRMCRPKWVNIGANTSTIKLPEPSPDKVAALVDALKMFTEVKIKSNLKRMAA